MNGAKLRVGILGATGTVGQKLVSLLRDHPWFVVTALSASERSAGRRYREAVHWLEPEPISEPQADMIIAEATLPLDCDFVLSALDATAARELEPAFAGAGYPVVSNASTYRTDPRVPLVVPEVNPDHVALVHCQGFGKGFIVTNPNCVTAGLVAALKPLEDAFGIEAVQVTTMQAVSGAGYPGVPALDILGNAVPFISGEEDKIASEPRKILGRMRQGRIAPAPLRISAQATRVPVLDGHLLSVSVKLSRHAGANEVRRAMADFVTPHQVAGLPSAPRELLRVFDTGPFPQPRLHAGLGGGMTVSVGRIRPCAVLDCRFVVLVHNTVRGAAGAAILNAELLTAQDLIRRRRPLAVTTPTGEPARGTSRRVREGATPRHRRQGPRGTRRG